MPRIAGVLMSDLDSELRDLHLCSQGRCSDTYPCDNLAMLHAAARIGAEIEREAWTANARHLESMLGNALAEVDQLKQALALSKSIRARGGK